MNRRSVTAAYPPKAAVGLIRDIREMIEAAHSAVAATVNAGLTVLYWRIGERINREILKGKRADYGKQILATLLQELSGDYSEGFSCSALIRMVKFVECFPDSGMRIVVEYPTMNDKNRTLKRANRSQANRRQTMSVFGT